MAKARSGSTAGYGRPVRANALAWLRTAALMLLVLGCIAKGMGPVKAAFLAGGKLDAAAIALCDDGQRSGNAETDAQPEPGAPICLNAGHGAPLAAGYSLTPPTSVRQLVHALPQGSCPLCWVSHPPHRPPRLSA